MTAGREGTPPRDQAVDLIKAVAIWDVVLSHTAATPFSGGIVGTKQI